jgi:hypothetical protein
VKTTRKSKDRDDLEFKAKGKKRLSEKKKPMVSQLLPIPPLDFHSHPASTFLDRRRKQRKRETNSQAKELRKTLGANRSDRSLRACKLTLRYRPSALSTMEDDGIQLSALASEPARVARRAEFHHRTSRGAKSNQAEECQS